jgi:hypothetical protein
MPPLVTAGGQNMMDSSFSSCCTSEDGDDEEEEDRTGSGSRNSLFGPQFASEDDIQDAKRTMKTHSCRAMGTMISKKYHLTSKGGCCFELKKEEWAPLVHLFIQKFVSLPSCFNNKKTPFIRCK